MHLSLRIFSMMSAAMLFCIAAPLYAEAPVFDVDAVQQQQFEAANEQAEANYPMPPPPSQQGAFVPMQQPAQAQASAPAASHAAPTTSVPATDGMSTQQRLHRMEQQLAAMQQSGENTEQVESLQQQVQSLRGQVEQLTHQLQQAQDQQKAMYADLDKRVAETPDKSTKAVAATDPVASEDNSFPAKQAPKVAAAKSVVKATAGANANAPASETKPAKAANQPDVAEEQQIYQTAYNLIKAKKYNEAVDALQGMLKKYPSGQFASNAHYWLGELYGLMGKNDQALNEFTTVVTTYPESQRVSDAQLKVGLIYSAQSKWSDAKSAFKKVINSHPGTASARVASEQLKQIKTAGH